MTLRNSKSSLLGVFLGLLLTTVSIFLFQGVSFAQSVVSTRPIEVDLFVNGVNLRRPEALLEKSLNSGEKTNLTIDNKPSGQMTVKSVKQLPITMIVTQPDGSVTVIPDPSAEFQTDLLITLAGEAQILNTSAVIGEGEVKIGNVAEIEGFNYNLNTTIVDVRVEE